MKKFFALVIALAMLLSVMALVSCSNKGEEEETKAKEKSTEASTEKYILNTEIKGGELWITYSDAPDKPVNAGRVENYYEGTEGLEFYLLPDGTYGVKGGSTYYLEEIVIPETYNGVKVTRILEEAFSGYINLTKVTFPNTVTHIDTNAFNACVKLEVATLPLGTKYIGNGAFGNCSSLKSVLICDQVEYIGEFAFINDISILSTNIPSSVTAIGRDAFKNCGGEIYCQVSEQPSSWDQQWNSSSLIVHWGE